MDKIKVGLIGSGFIASHHAYSYSLLPDVEVVAVSSLLEDQAKELMKKYNIPGEPIKDYHKLLEMDLDAVSVCLPNFLHEKVGIDALNAGKHILIEKPLARNVEEGLNLVKTAEKNGKKIFYCENNMYAPSFIKVKELIEEGAVGQIYMARGKEQHSGPHSSWFYKKGQAGGGALIDLGIHDIALLVWFLNSEVEKVFCQTTITQKDRGDFGECEVEDNAVGILYFKNGAQVTIEESWCAPGGYQMLIEIHGTNGEIIADPTRKTPIDVYSEKGYGYAVEKAGTTVGWTHPVPEEAWTFGYPQEIKHFMDCIRTGKGPKTDGKYGLKILAIVDAMYKSAESGKIEKVNYPL
ncbi:MAG: Gfo/Idh/MocA family protein [Promethearchaeota archaeon]